MSKSLNNYYDGQPHISHISFKFKVPVLRTRLMVDSSFINLDTTVKQKPQFISVYYQAKKEEVLIVHCFRISEQEQTLQTIGIMKTLLSHLVNV